MKLALVTGSRDWLDREALWRALDDEKPNIVVHGSCEVVRNDHRRLRGADADADAWARLNGVMLLTAPAHFDRMGGKAGPIRNSFHGEGRGGNPRWVARPATPGRRHRGPSARRLRHAGHDAQSRAASVAGAGCLCHKRRRPPRPKPGGSWFVLTRDQRWRRSLMVSISYWWRASSESTSRLRS